MSETLELTAAQALLARFKDVTGLPTNYAVGKRLGVSTQAVDGWERGGGMDDSSALRIAEALDLDPFPTIARVRLDRAKSPAERELWEKYCARVLVAAFIAVTAGHVAPSTAKALTHEIHAPEIDNLLIMRTWLSRFRSSLRLTMLSALRRFNGCALWFSVRFDLAHRFS